MSSFSNNSRPNLDSNFMQQQQNPIPTGPPYQDPFSATKNANNNYQNPFVSGQPILPGAQSTQSIDILTPQQSIFLKQIQSFLVQHNLEVIDVLTKDLSVKQLSTHISRDKLEDLGRHAKVDIIESQQLDTLVTRLIDPTSKAPNNLSIALLRQLLNTTGVSQVSTSESKTSKSMQVLKEFIIARKVASAEQLFPEAGESGLVDKEIFIKRASEEGKVPLEDAQSIATKFLDANGKVNLKNLNIELNGGAVHQQVQPIAVPSMTREQAQEMVYKVFDQIKRYLAMNEVNIVDIFLEVDNEDSFFNRQEFSEALSRLSFTVEGSDHNDRIDAFYAVYDQQRTRQFDYQLFLNDFYKRANSKQIKEPSNSGLGKLFKVYDATRRFMKQKQFISIASIFLDINQDQSSAASITGGLELAYDANEFIHQLTKVVGVKELDNYALQQTFVLALRKSDTEYDKIDYHRFADAVGYEMPFKSLIKKDDIRKNFYKTFLKDVGSIQNLEGVFRQQDINLQGSLQVNIFKNVIESFSQQLAQDSYGIKLIAGDFALNGQHNQINYQAFIQRLRAEFKKQAVLQKVFRSFHEYLQFKGTSDLYGTLFSKVDPQIEKKFSKLQLKQVLTDKLGLGADIAQQDVEQFFFEYDLSAKNDVKFLDIEKDFSEFQLNERKLGRLSKIMNMQAILRIIQKYVDTTGQTLRQIFGKTKFGDNDHINQYQFTKILHMMAQQVGGNDRIDDSSLNMFMNEISTTTTSLQSNSPTKERHDSSSKHVSFNELQSLYNMTFNVKDVDADSFIPVQVERLIVHLAKVTLENQRNNFDLKSQFLYPASPMSNFINDLKKEPLNCSRDHPQNILEELGKKYQSGHNQAINTQMLVMDIEGKVNKLKEKNTIFSELRKQVLRKNQNIEIVFSQALPEVSKFKIEYLAVKDFYNVFMFLECKGATMDKVRETLQNMIQPDDQGKFSYKEFIAEFKAGTQIEAVQARKGRRLYQSRDEIIHRIAYVIENRGLKTFGSLLADQDADGKLEIERDQFYRTIDSLQFSLGEGDIQELIRGYSKGQLVDLIKFKDDLNALISSQEYKVELKSLLNNLINERVVETLEPTTLKVKQDPKTQAQFRILARELACGLYVRDSEVISWFQKFGIFKKGSLTNREFQQAVESLDVTLVLEKPESIVTAYYESLVSRQANTIGYNETLLLIDQLNLMSSKDCPTPNRQKMIEDILQNIAIHICDNRLPLGDILTTFIPQGSSLIYRSDFHTTFLDNYLNMQWNSKTSTGLSPNQKLLLTTKYAPTQSTVSFPYQQFVDDMVRKQQESKGSIHVYMTQKEIDDDQANFFEEEKMNSGDQNIQQVVTLKDLPPLSKRNTHVVDNTVTKPSLKGSMQIAPFCFDDMMMSTYRKGLSVEMYFRAFSKTISGDSVLLKEDFGRALATLNIDWSSNVSKVNEIFDCLDIATHGGNFSKFVTAGDIGEAVFLNSSTNIEDIIAVSIMAIHKALKQKNMLGQLRELFNFFNSKRDNTCQGKEFKTIILEKLELGKTVVREYQVDNLLQRYKPQDQEGRVDFSLFIKDMEFCDLGISPALVWAISLATNICKSMIVLGTSMEQYFNKYSRMQGTLMQDEFSRSLNELQLDIYHPEEEQRDFFSHVQFTQTGGIVNPNQSSKISITQLINTIKLLCPKTPGLINQDIFERLWAESKKNNMSTSTVQSLFSEFDNEKTGLITFDIFRKALEDKLKIKSLILLDIQVLAKRYTSKGGQEMIQYDKFFQDYERFEQMGLRAGFDPLKDKQQAQSKIVVQQQKEISPEVRKIYSDMGMFCTKNGFSDKICDALGQTDTQHRGTLTYKQILEVFKSFKIMLVTKQMNLILDPLPVDQLDSSYNYLMLIEIMFSKQKAQEIQLKYKGGGVAAGVSNSFNQRSQVISQRFKDSIEVNYSSLLGIVHQISKGSYLLKESEFTKVFRQVGIVVTSSDHEFLLYAFNSLRSIQTQSMDFQQFISSFQILDTTSLIISALQKEIATNNIRISDEDGGTIFPPQKETVTVEDFQRFLSQQNIKLPNFTPEQVQQCYLQISDRREKMEKSQLIRILKNERDGPSQQQEWLPFIANEFIYHLINRNLDIFKFVNPTAKRLTLPQFQTLLDKLCYKASNPKDMPTLQEFFALLPETEEKFISIEKIVVQVRKLDPSYAAVTKQQTLPSDKTVSSKKPSQKAVEITTIKQLSLFSVKVKDTMQKINDQLKRNGITSKQLFEKVDINKNGVVEKAEMLKYFDNEIQVKGVTSDDIDLLFDALDMNKDNLVSLNEFCLCLEGVQNTVDQRIKSFDPDLEKSLKDEINFLFDFFDIDKNGQISQDELQSAMKASNPLITLTEIKNIMKQADTDKSESIDRKEFMNVMLPQLKLEMMNYERNLDDLRRMFKEFDSDQSNYLSKDELRQALIKLGFTLTDVQMDELMREIDLDNNQVIDIDEFIAFLSIADQIKFKNPNTKSIIVKIKQSRKLQATDFYNCFKDLPQFFQPSVTQENLEKRYVNTPSWGIYPEFDSKTMQYKDMQKLEEVTRMPQKKFIELYQPQIACEMVIEEISGVPLPKKEVYDWSNITNRELRAVLVDIRTQELLSNTYIVSASWKQDSPGKWETQAAAKTLIVRTNVGTNCQQYTHLLFELVLFTQKEDVNQQICCAWGSVPIGQLDKQTKLKIELKGGSFVQEMKVNKTDLHQEKKGGFEFLKMLTSSSDDAIMTLSTKPIGRLAEAVQLQISMLPANCVLNRRLLSFVAAFRLFAFKKLTKSQQQLLAPCGNFSIAQFRRIFDNPDVNLLLADCWDEPASTTTIEQILPKMEDYLTKLYAIIYSEDFYFDHVYPTRSLAIDSDLFLLRESMIKAQLSPAKFKKLMPVKKQLQGKENKSENEYRPFNISEMEIAISGIDSVQAKQDELTKMYMQMGLLY